MNHFIVVKLIFSLSVLTGALFTHAEGLDLNPIEVEYVIVAPDLQIKAEAISDGDEFKLLGLLNNEREKIIALKPRIIEQAIKLGLNLTELTASISLNESYDKRTATLQDVSALLPLQFIITIKTNDQSCRFIQGYNYSIKKEGSFDVKVYEDNSKLDELDCFNRDF